MERLLLMFDRTKMKENLVKAAIILVPTYTVAYLTDKMIYVVPMLVAASFFAHTFGLSSTKRNVDDNDSDGHDHAINNYPSD